MRSALAGDVSERCHAVARRRTCDWLSGSRSGESSRRHGSGGPGLSNSIGASDLPAQPCCRRRRRHRSRSRSRGSRREQIENPLYRGCEPVLDARQDDVGQRIAGTVTTSRVAARAHATQRGDSENRQRKSHRKSQVPDRQQHRAQADRHGRGKQVRRTGGRRTGLRPRTGRRGDRFQLSGDLCNRVVQHGTGRHCLKLDRVDLRHKAAGPQLVWWIDHQSQSHRHRSGEAGNTAEFMPNRNNFHLTPPNTAE